MTKAPFVFDYTTKNSPLEGVTITAGAQAPSGSRARRPADEATPLRAATRAPFPLPSNAERSEYEPATQLPQSGLVQPHISGAIDRKTGPEFSAGRPKVLFEGTSRYSPYFDVAADGKRILMIKQPPETQGTRRSGDRGVELV